MKVRQVAAVMAVLVIGLLVGSLVSGMFPARSIPAVGVLASRPSPQFYLVVIAGGGCVARLPTGQPGGPVAAHPDVAKLVAANAHVGTVFGARRELGIELTSAHVECARMIEANLESFPRAEEGRVRAVLAAFALEDVEVHEDADQRLIFSGWSGLACVVGVHHADETWVAVITPLSNGKCV